MTKRGNNPGHKGSKEPRIEREKKLVDSDKRQFTEEVDDHGHTGHGTTIQPLSYHAPLCLLPLLWTFNGNFLVCTGSGGEASPSSTKSIPSSLSRFLSPVRKRERNFTKNSRSMRFCPSIRGAPLWWSVSSIQQMGSSLSI